MTSRTAWMSLWLALAACTLPTDRLSAQDPNNPRSERFVTDRKSEVELRLTDEKPMFQFAVFGDRTGGPADGVKILAEAVTDVNVVRPDLVMTVGDLVQGYNQTPAWMRQMVEFKGIMDRLEMPWYPCAGNHDVYWRGPNRPPLEHEGNYETHFGPLWYAFEHKDCWFIVLYSDETNPETGQKGFGTPANHKMSEQQFAFLDRTLNRAKDAKHVFLFLHHPRWTGGRYGDHWGKIHERLVDAGNVSAVFAGHIHRMQYREMDGIEYFVLATVGGGQSGDAPEAGYLHQFDLINVREDGISVASLPVGEVSDHRAITEEVSNVVRQLADRWNPEIEGEVVMTEDFAADGTLSFVIENPTERTLDLVAQPDSGDARWSFVPDHAHTSLGAGERHTFRFRIRREAAPLDANFDMPKLLMRTDYLTDGARIKVPEKTIDLPIRVELPAPPTPDGERVLEVLDGSSYAYVPSSAVKVPNGPITLEGWLNANDVSGRTGWLAKTEGSEYGIFLNDQIITWSVHVGGRYVNVRPEQKISLNRWHHVAGVFDGNELRVYLDGKLVGSESGSGDRRNNALPFVIGGDVNRNGVGTSMFRGQLDEVRLSTVARYSGERFEPKRRFDADDATALLLHFDGFVGPWLFDSSPARAHAKVVGDAKLVSVGGL